MVCTQFSKVCIKLRCGLYKAPKICGAGVSQKMWAPELWAPSAAPKAFRKYFHKKRFLDTSFTKTQAEFRKRIVDTNTGSFESHVR